MRSRASSFKWEYPLLSLRSCNSFLRLLPCLPVTSIPPCIFPSITRCRRQFRLKMWPIQFAFRLRISCKIFLYSLTLSNTSSFLRWSVQLILSILLQHHISKLFRCFWSIARSVQVSAPLHYGNKNIRPVPSHLSCIRHVYFHICPLRWSGYNSVNIGFLIRCCVFCKQGYFFCFVNRNRCSEECASSFSNKFTINPKKLFLCNFTDF